MGPRRAPSRRTPSEDETSETQENMDIAALEQKAVEAERRAALLQRIASAQQAEREAKAALAEFNQEIPSHQIQAAESIARKPQWRPSPPTTYKGNDMKLLEDYLYQCKVAFRLPGAPEQESGRVAWAQQYLSTNLGTLWEIREESQLEAGVWEAFEDYLKNQISLPEVREDQYRVKLERAYQRDDQTPQDFDQYLYTIESKLPGPQKSDTERGEAYFYKLQESLRVQLRARYGKALDLRRSAVVLTATQEWQAMKSLNKQGNRKRLLSAGTQQKTHQGPPKRGDRRNDSEKPANSSPTAEKDDPPLPTCSHCHKVGHEEARCWIKHPHLRPKGKPRRNDSEKPVPEKA